jgi:Family of unknown function (DUF5947)
MSDSVEQRLAARRRADLISSLRQLNKQTVPANGAGGRPASNGRAAGEENCDLCGNGIDADHRHVLHLTERRILCVCESCMAMRSGDPELRPTGTRVLLLDHLDLSDELWARFAIPIGLAFFLRDSAAGGVVALYPSPAGATESELDLDAWNELVVANPELMTLEADAEALIVNRMSDPPRHAVAPIDECYRLVGMIKVSWDGISGGEGPQQAIDEFFSQLDVRGAAT